MATLRYLIALLLCTFWHGGICIVAGILRVPYRRGGVYDRAQRRWSRQILRFTGVPVRVEGAEHVAAQGPQIVVASHASFFDTIALLAYLPVHPKFIAKKELYGIPVFGGAIRAAGHVRMDRGNQKQAFAAYEETAQQMRRNKLTIVVYPEGTRTRTGELLPFKKGPFFFAIGAGVPIIPCYVSGAFQIQPKGSLRVRPRGMVIALGEAIPTTGLTTDDREALKSGAREAMEALKARVDAAEGAR
jgi:1-acyl-sn-glycerol-3-phosphate acyltransferase